MKRIGILTFHRAVNYGAFLQAFALFSYLRQCGHNSFIVDYWPDAHADAYRILNPRKVKSLLCHPFQLFLYLRKVMSTYKEASLRRSKMNSLVRKYFGLSQSPKYRAACNLNNLDADYVFYGSDQVWWKSTIQDYKGFDPVYWGEGVPQTVEKVAYAPSVGATQISQDDSDFVIKHLESFKSLSARESSVRDVISEITGREVSLVCDPVFLLEKNEWEKTCSSVKEKRYVLLYSLMESREAHDTAQSICYKFGLELIEVTGSVRKQVATKNCKQSLDAFELISYIRDADFVVSTSFHGVAFSVIFQKNFVALGMGKKSGRVSSLLQYLGISNRLIEGYSDSCTSPVNYTEVTPKLNTLVSESKQFITDSL